MHPTIYCRKNKYKSSIIACLTPLLTAGRCHPLSVLDDNTKHKVIHLATQIHDETSARDDKHQQLIYAASGTKKANISLYTDKKVDISKSFGTGNKYIIQSIEGYNISSYGEGHLLRARVKLVMWGQKSDTLHTIKLYIHS